VTKEVEIMGSLCRIVKRRTGLDLRPYKEKFLRRRVGVRMRATGKSDLASYVRHLKSEEGELEELVLCTTIHVSTFFRNPSTFSAIGEKVLPALFAGRRRGAVRFWSVGCARGEEPYSLAILIVEHLGGPPPRRKVRIEAVDIDEGILDDARKAVFRGTQLKEVDTDLRAKYFVGNGPYRLAPEVRGMVTFGRRDILADASAVEYDFILCRNLLIYIEREVQEAVLGRLHRALRPGGFLTLGRAEGMVGPARELFEVVDLKERIYRKAG
jgi:chemotaxis protein methyltransferase CheR